ncbi:hypothetical protein N7460_000371 [Penicillium canescens]|uniref:SMP-30/Gluconolactonase/LRE-like region domain-containing protein n=1 Tax=Penicillium canescens TaxID=5083 RepID=A0AAD6IMF8_PENCN|nr:hypothetical protein N7460_000371 [Penicillium canescens]
MSLLSVLWGDSAFSPLSFLGSNHQDVLPVHHNATSLASEDDFLSALPVGFEKVSLSYVKDNLAVIPGEWEAGDIILRGAAPRVHEAPAFVPETNELFFADTSETGWLWAINVDTHKARKVETSPPLPNVNGGRYHQGRVYLTTNGGPARGIYSVDPRDGTAIPIVNNFRGRHLNSPNDLVFDSNSNIWFTDPPYGWCQGFPGVKSPELPNGIYFFNTKTKALISVSNPVVTTPNGLAFSPDGSTFYVADSNSTSGKPMSHSPFSLRNVWAFDVKGSILSNPRLIYSNEAGWPDGLQVTRKGYLMVAALGGVDVVDPTSGALLGKINTPNDIIFNLERGPRQRDYGMWLLTGRDFIYKVLIKEQ